MYQIALKMLLRDKAKYLMLVGAIAFATLLITQQTAVFCGFMRWTAAFLLNSRAPIWVVDPNVEEVNDVKPMRDIELYRVRSVPGIAWAVPLYFSVQQARLNDGTFKAIALVGIDTDTLIGAPEILEGKLEDLRKTNAVFIDQFGVENMVEHNGHRLTIGDNFEINDHEARIVGIAKSIRAVFGTPFVYTTYDRALEIAPKVRRNLSYILVKPKPGENPETVVKRIDEATGLKAYTEDQFFWATIWWFFNNTGIPISFGTTILLGFIVGLAVSGQTFYLFVLENLRHFGALKAMGASNALLCRMLIFQASLAGVTGYGIGIGLAAIFGAYALYAGDPPFYLSLYVILISFVFILLICIVSALIGIRKISKFEPAEVFRG